MQVDLLLKRALKKEFLSAEEGEYLFHNAATSALMFVGNELKKQQKKHRYSERYGHQPHESRSQKSRL